MFVMRLPGAPGTFRRSRRDEKGNIVEIYLFPPGEPVEVTPEMLPAIADDVGHALVCVERDARDKIRIVDPPADLAVKVETAGGLIRRGKAPPADPSPEDLKRMGVPPPPRQPNAGPATEKKARSS